MSKELTRNNFELKPVTTKSEAGELSNGIYFDNIPYLDNETNESGCVHVFSIYNKMDRFFRKGYYTVPTKDNVITNCAYNNLYMTFKNRVDYSLGLILNSIRMEITKCGYGRNMSIVGLDSEDFFGIYNVECYKNLKAIKEEDLLFVLNTLSMNFASTLLNCIEIFGADSAESTQEMYMFANTICTEASDIFIINIIDIASSEIVDTLLKIVDNIELL